MCLDHFVDDAWGWRFFFSERHVGHVRLSDLEGTREYISDAIDPRPRGVAAAARTWSRRGGVSRLFSRFTWVCERQCSYRNPAIARSSYCPASESLPLAFPRSGLS